MIDKAFKVIAEELKKKPLDEVVQGMWISYYILKRGFSQEIFGIADND